MPNQLTFTTPITLPDLKFCKVDLGREINDTAKRLVVDILVYGDNNFKHPNTFQIVVTNGTVGKLEVFPEAGNSQDILKVRNTPLTADDNPNIANAWDRVMGAFMTTGNTGILNELQDLGALPPGTAA